LIKGKKVGRIGKIQLMEAKMLKTKVFYACNNPEGLENEMNDFLRSKPNIEVVQWLMQATGSMDHHVTVVCVYKE